MGIVFQNYALFENMTVRGNVEYALKFKPELKARRREIAQGVLEQLGLAEHLDKSVRQLSGGQQQRVSIARTLALNPEVILFDEPMSCLLYTSDSTMTLRSRASPLPSCLIRDPSSTKLLP